MPKLRRRQQTLQAELQSIADQTNDRAAYLRLTETLAKFLTRLRSFAQTLDLTERQRIVRLLVKEVLVGDDTIIIRHSIPIPSAPSGNDTSQLSGPPSEANNTGYLLRSGRSQPPFGQPVSALCVRCVDAAELSADCLRAVCGRHAGTGVRLMG